MIKLFIPILTSVSLLSLSSLDVFAGKDDNNNNDRAPKVNVKKKQKGKDINVTASFDNEEHLNLKIAGKQKGSKPSEIDFYQYLKTNKLAHITSLNLEMETDLTPKMVQHLHEYTPKLKALNLIGFTNVEDSEIIALIRHFPNIVILDETEEFVECYPAFGHQSKPVSWPLLQPILEKAIRKSIENPAYIERSFNVDVHRDDFTNFHNWLAEFRDQYKYPIGIGLSGNGAEGERVDRKYEVYHEEIKIHNYTKKEESAREVNEYKFFGGKLDPRLINERTFYNLMARVGFTEEDFKNGATGIQGRIAVKPIQLKSKTLANLKKELESIIEPTLLKSAEAYVSFVFNFPSESEYTLNDIFKFEEGIITSHFREFDRLATIFENDENRLYLCFQNDRRKILDLHGYEKDGKFNGISKVFAFELVREHISEAYDAYKDECTILTGRGKHRNENGSRGILVAAFPDWMKDESIKPFVKTFVPYGEGGFKVILNKPLKCDLTKPNLRNDPLQIVAAKLKQLIDSEDDRLLILTHDEGLDHKLIHFLAIHGHNLIGNIPPYQLERAPGQLRVTLLNEEDNSNDETSEETLPQVEQKPKPVQPQKNVNPEQPKAKQPQQKEQAKVVPKKPKQPAQAKQGPKPAKPQAQQNKGKGKQPEKNARTEGTQQKNKPAQAKQPQAKKPANAAQIKAAPKKVAKKSAVQQNNKKLSEKK